MTAQDQKIRAGQDFSSQLSAKLSSNVSRVANETYGNSLGIMPPQPWWDNLEPSFSLFPDEFELDLLTQSMVSSTVYADVALRTAIASMMSVLAMPLSFNPLQLARDKQNIGRYEALAETHDASQFFAKPDHKALGVEVHRRASKLASFTPDAGGSVDHLSFTSPYKTFVPELNERYQGFTRNRKAHAQFWQHGDAPRPVIVCIHGFLADPYWFNSKFLALPWFFKQGYDVMLYTLPHHGNRKGRMAPFSGHGYFSHGFSHINETVRQSIFDLQLFMSYLREQGHSQIGATGISLGGYTTSLLASVDDSLSFAIPNVPVISLADLILQWWPAGSMIKNGMKLLGINIREARKMLAVHSPLTYEPAIDKDKLMIVAGAGDRLAPPKHSRLLWEHWGRCNIHWFPGNHLFHLDQGKYLHEMLDFMQTNNVYGAPC